MRNEPIYLQIACANPRFTMLASDYLDIAGLKRL